MARILICVDSFKGSISSREAGLAISRGWNNVAPEDELSVVAFADGGEGTNDAVQAAQEGSKRIRKPLPDADEFGKKLRDAEGNFVPGSTKTDEERTIPVPSFVLDALMPNLEKKAPSDWVFIGKTGTVLDYGYFRRATFKPAVEKLKLMNVTTHTLRHTCASLLISLGTPITTVSYILGHASVKMTLDIYGHYYEDDTTSWMSALGDYISIS